jgi:hypothetical protein
VAAGSPKPAAGVHNAARVPKNKNQNYQTLDLFLMVNEAARSAAPARPTRQKFPPKAGLESFR